MRRFVIRLVAMIAVASPVLAEAPKPFADFTFKRVGVPKSGAGKRITVQIDPTAPAPAAPENDESEPSAAHTAGICMVLGRDLSCAGGCKRGRLEAALSHLKEAPTGQAVQFPRLQALKDITAAHGADILAATIGTDVSPALALAVIVVESSGRPMRSALRARRA